MNLPEGNSKCYDNTRISAYKTCPRSYFIRHILGWTGTGTGTALVFGSSWHAGQDALWTHAKNLRPMELVQKAQEAFEAKWTDEGMSLNISLEQQDFLLPRTPSIAKEMYVSYIDTRWRMLQEAELLAAEQPFAVPMPGVDGAWYIGRLDKVIKFNGTKLILEHKTTTAYATVGNFRNDYVDSWYSSSQVKGYQFCGSIYYPGLAGVWVDAALVHKKIHNAFKFIPIAHNGALLHEWIGGTRTWIAQIRADEDAFAQRGELGNDIFVKNEESCFGKYGPCPFIDICRASADPSKFEQPPAGFEKRMWEPFSVLGLDKVIQGDGNATSETA